MNFATRLARNSGRATPSLRCAPNVHYINQLRQESTHLPREAVQTNGATSAVRSGTIQNADRDGLIGGSDRSHDLWPGVVAAHEKERKFLKVPKARNAPTSPQAAMSISYEELGQRSKIPIEELKKTETTTTTKRQRRLAEFDWQQLHRSTVLNGPTDIALTFVDYLNVANRQAFRFDQLDLATLRFIQEVERVLGCPSEPGVHELRMAERDRQAIIVTEAEIAEMLKDCPTLYHMAERNTWPSIQEHGLMSTSALLDRYGIAGAERDAIEAARRPASVSLERESYGRAVVRDQFPMDDKGLTRCLQDGLTPPDWYRLLNAKVFFWLTQDRLSRLLNAGLYRLEEHDVLEVDSANSWRRMRMKSGSVPSTAVAPDPIRTRAGQQRFGGFRTTRMLPSDRRASAANGW